MNIVNTLPTAYTSANARLNSSEQASRFAINVNNNVSNDKDILENRQKESTRVIRVATESLKLNEFGSKFSFVNSPTSSNGKASSQAKPEQQYQSNQSLLAREEIGSLVGIDLFA